MKKLFLLLLATLAVYTLDAQEQGELRVGFNAGLGKWNFDLAAERRWGGDWDSPDYDTMRVDYKIRYQVIPQLGVHFKYRSENRDRDYGKSTWYNSSTRDRVELGTDFDFFGGYFSGWLVGGHDEDKFDKVDPLTGYVNGSGRDHGNYWEGDFGPTFKLTDRISLRPTIYTTGEYYDSYRMTEEQFRLMATFKVNDRVEIMPRIRMTLDKNLRNKPNTETGYDIDFAERIRSIRENISSESQSQGSQSSSLDHPFAISRLSHPKIAGFKSDESPHKVSQQPVRMKM